MRKIAFGIVLALALGAQVSAHADEVYVIDSGVWGFYQKYLRATNNGSKPGAFVITKDGLAAYYSWCQDTRCRVLASTYSQSALNDCERDSGTECVLFAVRDDIRVDYEIVGSAPTVPDSTVALAPAPVTKIVVSPEVQSDIDVYLRNTQSVARAWALAIAKDGSSVYSAACSTSNNFAVATCDPSHGSAQELAKRNAVKQCGGAAACVLLYAGDAKVADIEIVVQ